MIFDFKCINCNHIFEKNISSDEQFILCPKCGRYAKKQFHACTNIYIPSYYHTSRSDIFSDTEWQDLKKDPNIERA
jgi:putative FmdB family regulatory protein